MGKGAGLVTLLTTPLWWLHAAGRVGTAALVWWLLAEGDVTSWTIGAPVVALAALASLYWSGTVPYRVSPTGVLRFAAVFARASLIGGLDVARRALTPSLPLDPLLQTQRTTLPPGAPRWLLTTTLSLVPGSLAVCLDDDVITLHWLDAAMAHGDTFAHLERKVAQVFALEPNA